MFVSFAVIGTRLVGWTVNSTCSHSSICSTVSKTDTAERLDDGGGAAGVSAIVDALKKKQEEMLINVLYTLRN